MEEHRGRPIAVAVCASSLVAFTFIGSATCGTRRPLAEVPSRATAPSSASAAPSARVAPDAGAGRPALSLPIAASRVGAGDVIVAALDVPSRGIRLLRVNADDAVVADRLVFEDVAWSSEAELRTYPAGDGVAVVWRGLRGGRLVREVVVVGGDLAARAPAAEVAGGTCATQDALYATDGRHVHVRPWGESSSPVALANVEDATLLCGAHRAFVVAEDEERLTLLPAVGGSGARPDAAAIGAAERDAAPTASDKRVVFLEESAFGEDDQRERAEYTVGDDVGVMRLGASGALWSRELRGGVLGPLRKLTSSIPRDDDVVAVDASARVVVVVFTQDVSETCTDGGSGTKVMALRVDRTTLEEATLELSPGACGREVGPFFTAAVGEGVSVAWVERASARTKEKAPIVGLAHRVVGPEGPGAALGRVEQAADGLVDAGCDEKRCYAVALARTAGADVMTPGIVRVLRYP